MNSVPGILFTSGRNCGPIAAHLKKVWGNGIRLFIADMEVMNMVPEGCTFIKVPRTDNEDFTSFLLKQCSDQDIDVVIPTTGMDVAYFSMNEALYKAQGIHITLSRREVNELTLDKRNCYDYLKAHDIPTPEYYEVIDAADFQYAAAQLGYPKHKICMKPSRYPNGSGKGFRVIDNTSDVYRRMFYELPSQMFVVSYDAVMQAMKETADIPPMLVMEYMPGDEYSVYCFCDKGEAIYIIPHIKHSLIDTNTASGEVFYNEEIIELSRRICTLLKPEYNINLQFRYDRNNKPKLMEINPRMAGTILLSVTSGPDLLSYAIGKALGMEYPKDKSIDYGMKIERVITDTFYK